MLEVMAILVKVPKNPKKLGDSIGVKVPRAQENNVTYQQATTCGIGGIYFLDSWSLLRPDYIIWYNTEVGNVSYHCYI